MLRNVWSILLTGMIALVASDLFGLDKEERRLLEEIVDTIDEEVKGIRQLLAGGAVDLGQLLDARRRLAAARLQLAVNPQERVSLWEEIVRDAAETEKHAKQLVEASIGTSIDLGRARSAHLEAQLGLYRAKKELQPQASRSPR